MDRCHDPRTCKQPGCHEALRPVDREALEAVRKIREREREYLRVDVLFARIHQRRGRDLAVAWFQDRCHEPVLWPRYTPPACVAQDPTAGQVTS